MNLERSKHLTELTARKVIHQPHHPFGPFDGRKKCVHTRGFCFRTIQSQSFHGFAFPSIPLIPGGSRCYALETTFLAFICMSNGKARNRHSEIGVLNHFLSLSSQQDGINGRISTPIWTDQEIFACILLLWCLAWAR